MKHIRKQQIKVRKRRSKILLWFIFFGTLFLFLGAGIIVWKITNTPPAEQPDRFVKTKNLFIEIVEKEEDIRKVKNTATEENHKTNGLAICMYHYVYDKDNPPDSLNNNYIEVNALEEELKYLVENEYYFPTWEEVRQYVDGELLLPEKSVVLTFDDGAKSFLELGAPLFNKYQIPVTSFLITEQNGEDKVAKYKSDYVSFESHSHNMHRAGGNIGHGGIFPIMPYDEALADLQKSIEICQNGNAFAYPYGDYTDSCAEIIKDAGFLCAVTTKNGRAYPGDNPLLLPRMRMSRGQTLNEFIYMVE